MTELQLWNVSVKDATMTKGFSIVTERGAPVALAEEIALYASRDMEPDREVVSMSRTCTVYAKGGIDENL